MEYPMLYSLSNTGFKHSIFTQSITCENYKPYIFCVVQFHPSSEVEYTLEWCILSMTAVHISCLKYEADLTCLNF
jgi:hypothetical protein